MKNLSARTFFLFIFIFVLITFANAQTNDSGNSQPPKKIKPLKILKRPPASVQGQCSQISGRVTLLVTFDKSAQVTDVNMISSSGCDFFDNNVVKAAKNIKFEPQTEDNIPVTIKKQIQYNFTVY